MQAEGTICAVDIGASSSTICAFNDKGFQIVINQANFRQTPSIVGYTAMERMIGESGLIKIKTNYQNTIKSPQRLIGIDASSNIIEEQLKYSTVKFRYQNGLYFTISTREGQTLQYSSEQVLIAYMTKIGLIMSSHSIKPMFLAVSVPSFTNCKERETIYRCAKIAGLGEIIILDDWVSIATDYAYFRLRELEEELQPRNVLFIDAGHSKFSAYLCEISRAQGKIIKAEYLKYTGSRNMDNIILQFYASKFKKSTGCDLLKNPKGLTKMLQNIQKQRKILSANSQQHLNIECLVGEDDFEYTMKREEFQDLIMPVLGEMATPLSNIKQFTQSKMIKLKAIQLIGGASRIPFFQHVVKDIFGMELSRTLNATQSIVRGANIYSALQLGFSKEVGFSVQNYNFYDFVIFSNNIAESKRQFGRNSKQYNSKSRHIVFPQGPISLPMDKSIKFEGQGEVQILLFFTLTSGAELMGRSECYFRVNAPCIVKFFLDSHKILSANSTVIGSKESHDISFCNIDMKTWQSYAEIEAKLKQRDLDIVQIYHRKNQYEALLYESRDRINSKYHDYITVQERNSVLDMIKEGEEWITNHLEIADLTQYNQRLQTLASIINTFIQRQDAHNNIQASYNDFIKTADKAISTIKNKQKVQEIQILKQSMTQLYTKSIDSKWEYPKLTKEQCIEARQSIIKTCLK